MCQILHDDFFFYRKKKSSSLELYISYQFRRPCANFKVTPRQWKIKIVVVFFQFILIESSANVCGYYMHGTFIAGRDFMPF